MLFETLLSVMVNSRWPPAGMRMSAFKACKLKCRDAQDAVRGRDGYDFFGNRIRVELSNGSREAGRGGGRGGGMGGPPPQTFRGRGTGFRALVKGLPISCSWQDLKVGWGSASGLCLWCLSCKTLPICSSWQNLR